MLVRIDEAASYANGLTVIDKAYKLQGPNCETYKTDQHPNYWQLSAIPHSNLLRLGDAVACAKHVLLHGFDFWTASQTHPPFETREGHTKGKVLGVESTKCEIP